MGFHLPEIAPAKRALTLLDEFKAFAFKGNVVDLAVGVIIGAAFGKITDSLVKHVIMPLIGVISGGSADKAADWAGKLTWHTSRGDIPYGLFLAEVLNFLIVALVLFFVIRKFLGWVLSLRTQQAVAPPPPPPDVQLLTEIRDLLKLQIEQGR
jgi:large conductance mechanosensitive channel